MSSFPGGKSEGLKNCILQLVFQIHFSSGLSPSAAGVMPAVPQPPPWGVLQPEGLRRPGAVPAGGSPANGAQGTAPERRAGAAPLPSAHLSDVMKCQRYRHRPPRP